MLHSYFVALAKESVSQNRKNILSLLESDARARCLDLGCDDGKWTIELGKTIKTKKLFGIELATKAVKSAKEKSIKVKVADLNARFPFSGGYFDVVHSNQVIEHLFDTDRFMSEIYRVLKPGGYAVISTENLASWHNIFSLIMGFQPFSMVNFSIKGSIGNPFNLWKNDTNGKTNNKYWQHMRLFAFSGLTDLFGKYGFVVEKVMSAGYYPLWGKLAEFDPRHGHWLTVKVRKPL